MASLCLVLLTVKPALNRQPESMQLCSIKQLSLTALQFSTSCFTIWVTLSSCHSASSSYFLSANKNAFNVRHFFVRGLGPVQLIQYYSSLDARNHCTAVCSQIGSRTAVYLATSLREQSPWNILFPSNKALLTPPTGVIYQEIYWSCAVSDGWLQRASCCLYRRLQRWLVM